MSKLTLELGRARGGSGGGAPSKAKEDGGGGEGEYEDGWSDFDAGWFRLADLLRGTCTAERGAPWRSRRRFWSAALYKDNAATLDDLHEAVTTLEDTHRIARRVLGGAHPIMMAIEEPLRESRAALRARETPPPGSARP